MPNKLERSDSCQSDATPSSVLFDVVKTNQVKRLKSLLLSGLDINQLSAEKTSLLWQAVSYGHREMIHFLLQQPNQPSAKVGI